MCTALHLPAHVHVVSMDADHSVQGLANHIAEQLREALHQRGRAVFSVSGGRSPMALFECLSRADLDWARVSVTLVDERQVSEDHPASNARLVRQHLLQDRAAAAQLVSMVGSQTPSQAAGWHDLAAQVSDRLLALGPADVTLLGMGMDGHFASWFSQAPEVAQGLNLDQNLACLAVHLPHPPPEAPFDRLSQTLAHLAKSRLCVLPITGAEKQHAWAQACANPGLQWPVSVWLSMTSTPLLLWITP